MTLPTTTLATRQLQIEFLFLDLDTCTRCRATDQTLLEAIERTRPALDAAGVTVSVTKTLVASETQARQLGFVSSPTIRIDGVDIAGELVESACDTCSETCACDGGVDCRDWLYQGQRSTQPAWADCRSDHAARGRRRPRQPNPGPAATTHGAGQPPPVLRRRSRPGGRHTILRLLYRRGPGRLLRTRRQGRLLRHRSRGGVVLVRLQRWALKPHHGAMMATATPRSTAHDEGLPALRAHLHTFIARRVESPEVADDLTQDVLVRLLTHNDGRVEHPTAWLYRVARNVIIDHYRTRSSGSRRQSRLDADDLAPAGPAQDPFADDPQAAQRELAGCLRPLVDQLAEPYRSAVSAVDLGGQTHTDVAQAVGLSVSGMKSRVQRGRRQLRQLLTDCCRVHTSPTGSISGYEPLTGCHPTPSGDNSCR